MRLLMIALAAVLLAGCAIVPIEPYYGYGRPHGYYERPYRYYEPLPYGGWHHYYGPRGDYRRW